LQPTRPSGILHEPPQFGGRSDSTKDTHMFDQVLVIVSVTGLVMVTPGPDMMLVLRNTLLRGRRAGLHTSMGILCGNLVHISYCLLGIGLLISQSIMAFAVLKYAAAAYLIYLGVMSFRSDARTLDTRAIEGVRRERACFGQGFVNNLLNPKGTLFYLGVFTTVLTPDTSASAMLVLILIMMLVSASFWLCFVYTLDRPAIRAFVERSQRTVNRLCGVALCLLGVRVALSTR
jgi:RhtB (resistance to homoserine/threonine) family protein